MDILPVIITGTLAFAGRAILKATIDNNNRVTIAVTSPTAASDATTASVGIRVLYIKE